MQSLMETDVDGLIGAERHERSCERTTYRNGYRDQTLDTRLGSLEPRHTSEKALVAVIQEAWVSGVSTRRVGDLVQAMGLAGISKMHGEQAVQGHRRACERLSGSPPGRDWPYLWLDDTYLKQRKGGRITSVAAIIAIAVTRTASAGSWPAHRALGGGNLLVDDPEKLDPSRPARH